MSARRKAKKRDRLTNRQIQSYIDRPLRDTQACPTPGKVAYPTRHHAKDAAKRSLPFLARTTREQDAAARPESTSRGKVRVYRCLCRRWHLGHLPKQIRSGPDHRDRFETA